jgi:hypothetical protein
MPLMDAATVANHSHKPLILFADYPFTREGGLQSLQRPLE